MSQNSNVARLKWVPLTKDWPREKGFRNVNTCGVYKLLCAMPELWPQAYSPKVFSLRHCLLRIVTSICPKDSKKVCLWIVVPKLPSSLACQTYACDHDTGLIVHLDDPSDPEVFWIGRRDGTKHLIFFLFEETTYCEPRRGFRHKLAEFMKPSGRARHLSLLLSCRKCRIGERMSSITQQ